jgi:hypothetical protein
LSLNLSRYSMQSSTRERGQTRTRVDLSINLTSDFLDLPTYNFQPK